MRFITAVFLALGLAQSGFALAPASAGPEVVTALRALVESGGTITSEAALSQATGNQAIGALFPTVNGLYQSMQKSGKVAQVTDWDALSAKSTAMTSEQTVAALSGLVKSGKAVTQQNALAALSVPAARTAKPALNQEAAQANASATYTSLSCPTGATQCEALVKTLEASKAGNGALSVSEAEQVAQAFGYYAQIIRSNAANCGAAGEKCVTNLMEGAAGMLNTFKTRLNQPFMEAAITSGKTEKSDFTQFAGNNGAIAEGLKNAALLGQGMGSDLITCATQGGL